MENFNLCGPSLTKCQQPQEEWKSNWNAASKRDSLPECGLVLVSKCFSLWFMLLLNILHLLETKSPRYLLPEVDLARLAWRAVVWKCSGLLEVGKKGVSTSRGVGWRMLRLSWGSKNKEHLTQNLSVWTELSPAKLFINNYKALKSFPVHKNWDSHSGLAGKGTFDPAQLYHRASHPVPALGHSAQSQGWKNCWGKGAETELLKAGNIDRVDSWGIYTTSSSPVLKAGG